MTRNCRKLEIWIQSMATIEEVSGRTTVKKLAHLLCISLDSCFELGTQLVLAQKLVR